MNRTPAQCKEYRKTHGSWFAQFERTPRRRFSAGKSRANRRGVIWTLTREQHQALLSQPCHYCGGPLPETSHGLDRTDNTLGYTLENVVPCCKFCNVAKNEMTYAQFKEWVTRVYSKM